MRRFAAVLVALAVALGMPDFAAAEGAEDAPAETGYETDFFTIVLSDDYYVLTMNNILARIEEDQEKNYQVFIDIAPYRHIRATHFGRNDLFFYLNVDVIPTDLSMDLSSLTDEEMEGAAMPALWEDYLPADPSIETMKLEQVSAWHEETQSGTYACYYLVTPLEITGGYLNEKYVFLTLIQKQGARYLVAISTNFFHEGSQRETAPEERMALYRAAIDGIIYDRDEPEKVRDD